LWAEGRYVYQGGLGDAGANFQVRPSEAGSCPCDQPQKVGGTVAECLQPQGRCCKPVGSRVAILVGQTALKRELGALSCGLSREVEWIWVTVAQVGQTKKCPEAPSCGGAGFDGELGPVAWICFFSSSSLQPCACCVPSHMVAKEVEVKSHGSWGEKATEVTILLLIPCRDSP
jgi:hypothetical protein